MTTKAYDVEKALREVAHRLQPGCLLVLLTNGMGLAEIARATCPGATLYCGTTTEGAFIEPSGIVCHAGRGLTMVGSQDDPATPDWFRSWRGMTLECRWEEQITDALWHKLAINCAINPLTALHGCRNGELLQQAPLKEALQAICAEIAEISMALGYTRTAAGIHEDAVAVAAATADNRSSMLQDVAHKRPTEIDFITGYLVRRAEDAGIPVPRNQALLQELRHD